MTFENDLKSKQIVDLWLYFAANFAEFNRN